MNSGNGLNSCGCHRGIVLEYNHGLKEGASSMEENQGMTDGQYGDHLRAVIADLERIKKLGVSEEFLKTVLEAIHLESINLQNRIMNR